MSAVIYYIIYKYVNIFRISVVIGHETRKRTAKRVNEVLKGVGGKRTHII